MNHPTLPSPVRSTGVAVNSLIAFLTVMLSVGAHFAGAQTPQSSNSPAPQFEGSLDKVEVSTLGGWAWDASRPNSAIKVDIYDGQKLLATITAETFRADLKAVQKGDGKHGFDYLMPQSLRDGQSHTISVKYSGTDSELPGSPKTLLFPKA
jgi:hypothetical protein